MTEPVLQGCDTAWVGQRLKRRIPELATVWRGRVEQLLVVERQATLPSRQLAEHVPDLMAAVAAALEAKGESEPLDAESLQRAARLGERRFQQHASVHQLLREFQVLGDVLDEFLEQELAERPTGDALAGVRAGRRITQALRTLQLLAVDAFVACYAGTMDQQAEQLRKFSRLVSHEIRQPLGVLQVIAKALPTRDGDGDAARMMDIFDRNVARLTDVTGRLERLARLTTGTDLAPSERAVDLSTVVASAAAQLAGMAAERAVEVVVGPALPVLRLDPARAELVFINLIANGIQHADPQKPRRFVEVRRADGDEPAVIVRDNGIGIPATRLQHIFREFVRAHAQRHDEVRVRGLGLGLSIVRECMDAASGSVRVESIEGAGTTFKLTWSLR